MDKRWESLELLRDNRYHIIGKWWFFSTSLCKKYYIMYNISKINGAGRYKGFLASIEVVHKCSLALLYNRYHIIYNLFKISGAVCYKGFMAIIGVGT